MWSAELPRDLRLLWEALPSINQRFFVSTVAITAADFLLGTAADFDSRSRWLHQNFDELGNWTAIQATPSAPGSCLVAALVLQDRRAEI